jgi:L-alanine-DL-glutamate epimerase-like enolase superfamily enzyme
MPLELSLREESWPIAGSFAISRGSKTSADVMLVTLGDDGHHGRGECVPYARYGETLASVKSQILALKPDLDAGLTADELQTLLPAGAARNALDCALHDLAAKKTGQRIWQLLGLPAPTAQTTAFTLSLDSPENMAAAARQSAARPLLKVKLGGDDDAARMRAVRNGAPKAKIIVDANEAWSPENIESLMETAAKLDILLIEQPLHADVDGVLRKIEHIVPICADESAHDRNGLAELAERYDLINIKTDKTGGLTEALALRQAAEKLDFGIMVGCMLGTSLAMAPALMVAQATSFVDLDGPLLLREDRPDGLQYRDGQIFPPSAKLWG